MISVSYIKLLKQARHRKPKVLRVLIVHQQMLKGFILIVTKRTFGHAWRDQFYFKQNIVCVQYTIYDFVLKVSTLCLLQRGQGEDHKFPSNVNELHLFTVSRGKPRLR